MSIKPQVPSSNWDPTAILSKKSFQPNFSDLTIKNGCDIHTVVKILENAENRAKMAKKSREKEFQNCLELFL